VLTIESRQLQISNVQSHRPPGLAKVASKTKGKERDVVTATVVPRHTLPHWYSWTGRIMGPLSPLGSIFDV